MDPTRFDALARALASRRSALRGLATAALAPLAAAGQGRGGPSAQGVCGGGVLDKCARDADCCNKRCDAKKGRCRCARRGEACTRDANCCDRAPNGPLTCQGQPGARTCQPVPCPGGCGECQKCRRGSCVADAAKAGTPCEGGRVCTAAGACADCSDADNPCPDGGCCRPDGTCADTQTDGANCGTCGSRCPLNETCVAGACKCGSFPSRATSTFTCCPGGSSSSTCVYPGSGFVVADTCASADSCPTGYTECPGEECAACCPPGTTCDAAGGFCRQ